MKWVNCLLVFPISSIGGVPLERISNHLIRKATLSVVASGVIAGPSGMIAGGVLRVCKKKESAIILTVQQGPAEVEILFGGVGKDDVEKGYPRFVNLLK